MGAGEKQPRLKNWWGPIWRGLIADSTGKHYQNMRAAVWLFLYFVVHADRKTGRLFRHYETISRDTGIKPRTIRQWLFILRKQDYVQVKHSGKSVAIHIQIRKWKPLIGSSHRESDKED